MRSLVGLPGPLQGGWRRAPGLPEPRRFVSVPFSALGGPGLLPWPGRERNNISRLLRPGEARHGPSRSVLAIGLQVHRTQADALRAPAAEGVPLRGAARDVVAAATRRAD